jgi:hypothetical protein
MSPHAWTEDQLVEQPAVAGPAHTKSLSHQGLAAGTPIPATGFAFEHGAPVALAIDPPLIADTVCKHSGVQWQAAEVVANLCWLFVALGERIDDPFVCVEPWPWAAGRGLGAGVREVRWNF